MTLELYQDDDDDADDDDNVLPFALPLSAPHDQRIQPKGPILPTTAWPSQTPTAPSASAIGGVRRSPPQQLQQPLPTQGAKRNKQLSFSLLTDPFTMSSFPLNNSACLHNSVLSPSSSSMSAAAGGQAVVVPELMASVVSQTTNSITSDNSSSCCHPSNGNHHVGGGESYSGGGGFGSTDRSFLMTTDSDYLDAASSLLLLIPTPPTTTISSESALGPQFSMTTSTTIAQQQQQQQQYAGTSNCKATTTATTPANLPALTTLSDFSVLLQQADDRFAPPNIKTSPSTVASTETTTAGTHPHPHPHPLQPSVTVHQHRHHPSFTASSAAAVGVQPTKPNVRRLLLRKQQGLPVLPEEPEDVSVTAATDVDDGSLILEGYECLSRTNSYTSSENTNHSGAGAVPSGMYHQLKTTPPFRMSPSASGRRNDERRLAALAGATVVTTDHHSFTVTVDLRHHGCSVRDVMDVLGNPDFLQFWCDAVPSSVVIVRSSEGARNAVERQRHQQQQHAADNNREYEGEWIEATCPTLIAPSSSSSLLVGGTRRSLLSNIWTAFWTNGLGFFPVYGRITMFVERLSGRVGLTLGPFPGHTELCHQIKVVTLDNNSTSGSCGIGIDSGSNGSPTIRIVNSVRLRRCNDNDENGGGGGETVAFCGLADLWQRCSEPSIEDCIDQVLSSMARLRFLMENGEVVVATTNRVSSSSSTNVSTPERAAVANDLTHESNSPLLVHAS